MFNTKIIINLTIWLLLFILFFFKKVFMQEQQLYYFYNNFLQDNFSMLMLLTTVLTLLIALTIADNKYFLKNTFSFFLFLSFLMFIVGLITSTNIITFFIFYELLLLPSYILVKESSPNRRSEFVANYFLL